MAFVFATPVTPSLAFPAVVWSVTDEAASAATLDVDGFFDSSDGSGFLACSALKPGGGNPDPTLPFVEVSVA